VQRLLQEHKEDAMLARRLTGIVTDADMKGEVQDVLRRSVSEDELKAVCEQLGLGRMTQARLARLSG
jgi:translation initiation factor RLI1